jgi:nucleolar protein 9
MPREKKKRGRRDEEKSKRNVEDLEEDDQVIATDDPPPKRRKSTEEDYIPLGFDNQQNSVVNAPPMDSLFYGLLDQEEQDYFKQADDMLLANQFPNAQERGLFIESVWNEASGKELKIACSQSSSRVLERLIGNSHKGQLKTLFTKFEGHFLNLVQHRFASHCCEALFLRSALVLTEDTSPLKKSKKGRSGEGEQPQMEELFIGALNELEGSIGYLLTERYASHTLRVLFVVLSGEPLDHPALASKKKELNGQVRIEKERQQRRRVPEIFLESLDKLIQESASGLGETYLRALATHPTGNPILQLLLSIELSRHGKSKGKDQDSILRRLIPDDSIHEDSTSYSFLRGLLYEPVGSRLLEAIVQFAPGKTFKAIYKALFKGKLGVAARNDTATFVAIRVLERLGKEDLEDAMPSILAEIPTLMQRSKYAILRTLIERCEVRDVATSPIRDIFRQNDVFGDDPKIMIKKMLNIGISEETGTTEPPQKQRHGAQLVHSMLSSPGLLSELVFEGLLTLKPDEVIALAKNSNTSRVIQLSLTVSSSSAQFRRKFLPRFYGQLCGLALDARGSHTVDALWTATDDLFFVKERFAEEIAKAESELRESFVGRTVWRNWSMDTYNRNKKVWLQDAKNHGHGLIGNEQEMPEVGKRPKSAIDQARARFASQAAQKQRQYGSHPIVPTNA